jgi:hypothetical protein
LLGYAAKGLEYFFVPIGFGDIAHGSIGGEDG